jgi:hypothetical protein
MYGDIHERRREDSARFDLDGPHFGADAFVFGVIAKVFKIGVLGHPFEIPVAEIYGRVEGFNGQLDLAGQGVAACQIVVNQGVIRSQAREAFVHLQAL